MRKKAVSPTTPTVTPEQLAVIEQQQAAQKQAFDQEKALIAQQQQQQTSAMQAMLNVYSRQVDDLQTTRNQQQLEQQQLVEAQQKQAQLIESDRVRSEADMAQQRSRTTRYANRMNGVLSNRRQARSNNRVITSPAPDAVSSSPTPIFGKRSQL